MGSLVNPKTDLDWSNGFRVNLLCKLRWIYIGCRLGGKVIVKYSDRFNFRLFLSFGFPSPTKILNQRRRRRRCFNSFPKFPREENMFAVGLHTRSREGVLTEKIKNRSLIRRQTFFLEFYQKQSMSSTRKKRMRFRFSSSQRCGWHENSGRMVWKDAVFPACSLQHYQAK